MNNPFKNSNSNLRYYSFDYYLKRTYHQKIFKVPLDAGFSCPNRDGNYGVGGCSFCSSLGSGEFVQDKRVSLKTQFETGKEIMLKKWPEGKAIAYFQAYTNTYCDIKQMKEYFEPFLERDDVVALAIATRPDCLDQEKIEYLNSLTNRKDIWIELGLQTIHDQTATAFNRGYPTEVFFKCIEHLKESNLKICVHLLNGLPNETAEMMLESAKAIASLPIHGVKIHMLHLLSDSRLGQDYLKNSWELLSKEEYVNIVANQLEVFPETLVIQRLTGDGIEEKLLAPKWTQKKVIVMNDIQKELVRRNSYQGIKYETN